MSDYLAPPVSSVVGRPIPGPPMSNIQYSSPHYYYSMGLTQNRTMAVIGIIAGILVITYIVSNMKKEVNR